jgi:hypothetical protein
MDSAIESEYLLTARLQNLERELATLPNGRDHIRRSGWTTDLRRRCGALFVALAAAARGPARLSRPA